LEIEWINPNQQPIAQKQYHYSYEDLLFTKAEVASLLEADLVEEVKSAWA